MTKALALAALLLAVPADARAQVCTPTEVPPMYRQADPASPSHADGDWVPDGEVWIVRAAGIGVYQYTGPGLEYKLQIERAIYWPSGVYAGTWLIPLAVNESLVQGTPMLALTRTVILMPKERLVARVLSPPTGVPPTGLLMNLFYLALKVPLACLDRLVLAGSGAGTTTVTAAPDYAALIAATTALQDAAAALQAAIPR